MQQEPPAHSPQVSDNALRSCIQCNQDCILQRCSKEWQQRLNEEKGYVRYQKGDYILKKDTPVHGLYFICFGKVKVVSPGIYNKNQIVRLAKEGDVLGHRGYGGEVYPIDAIALDETTVSVIDNQLLYEAFLKNPKFTYKLMIYYSKELRKTETRMKYLAQMNVREKVSEALLFVYNIFGRKENGKYLLNVPLQRKDLADIAGTNADQVSRKLSELKQEKIIETNGRDIILRDKQALLDILDPFDLRFSFSV